MQIKVGVLLRNIYIIQNLNIFKMLSLLKFMQGF
jgi:hypothetical protein